MRSINLITLTLVIVGGLIGDWSGCLVSTSWRRSSGKCPQSRVSSMCWSAFRRSGRSSRCCELPPEMKFGRDVPPKHRDLDRTMPH